MAILKDGSLVDAPLGTAITGAICIVLDDNIPSCEMCGHAGENREHVLCHCLRFMEEREGLRSASNLVLKVEMLN